MADVCYLGEDFDVFFPVAKDARGATVSLVGATLYCSAQTGTATAVAAQATYVDEAAGTSRARFSSAQTAGFVVGGTYVYDGRVRLASGEIHTIGRGEFRVAAAKTPTPV